MLPLLRRAEEYVRGAPWAPRSSCTPALVSPLSRTSTWTHSLLTVREKGQLQLVLSGFKKRLWGIYIFILDVHDLSFWTCPEVIAESGWFIYLKSARTCAQAFACLAWGNSAGRQCHRYPLPPQFSVALLIHRLKKVNLGYTNWTGRLLAITLPKSLCGFRSDKGIHDGKWLPETSPTPPSIAIPLTSPQTPITKYYLSAS